MDKIIIQGQFPILPGQVVRAKKAALILRERVLREDAGVILYEFFVDESNATMAMTEMYVDELSLLAHINASEFTDLFKALDFLSGKVQVHGNPSDTLRKKLYEIAGPTDIFLPIV